MYENGLFDKALHIKACEPLNTADSPTTTYGCRCANPLVCPRGNMDNVCAFVTADHVCRAPARSWVKQYKLLSGK